MEKFKYIVFVISCCYSFAANAQITVTNKGVEITNTSDIHIQGNYINTNNAAIASSGTIYISNDLTNTSAKALFVTAAGTVVLSGSGKQTISGDSNNFFALVINKPSGEVQLQKSIAVSNRLDMQQGNIQLNGKDIHLGLTGMLINEKNTSRVYGNAGTISTRVFLSGSSITTNLSGLGLYLATASNFGYTDILRGHAIQHSNGDTSIYRYYQINPVDPSISGHVDSLKISYLDPEASTGEETYKIYASTDLGFTWLTKGGKADPLNNSITTTSISPPDISKIRVSVFPVINYATCLPNDPDYVSAVFLVSTNDFNGDSVKFIQLTEGQISAFTWNFGDLTTNTTDRDPVHVYSLSDTEKASFIVSMNITNGICSDTRVKKITISNKPPLRLEDDLTMYDLFQTAAVYPNPSLNEVTIELSSSGKTDVKILLTDTQGGFVKEALLSNGTTKQQLDINDLAQGMYLLSLQAGEDQKVFKLVKL